MLEMLGSAWSIVSVIFIFSILIFVHELGHFAAALAVGVRPERFFIGFDIFGLGIKKEFRGCVYGIGLLPLGGYVKLAGQSDDPREQAIGHGKPDEIGSKPLWAQATIIVAGVVMNMIFGYLLLVYAFSIGYPQVPPVVGEVNKNTPAYMGGLRSGDRILSIDDTPMINMTEIKQYIVLNSAEYLDMKVQRGEQELTLRLKGAMGPQGYSQIGIIPPQSSKVSSIDADPFSGKEIAKYLEDGDEIISVNNIDLPKNKAAGNVLNEILASNTGKTLPAKVLRNGETIETKLPVIGAGAYDIGYSVKVKIDSVVDGSPAQKAGLSGNDWITGLFVDGKRHPLLGSRQVTDLIQSRAYMPVKLDIERNGKAIEALEVKPAYMGWNLEIPEGQDTLLGITGKDTEAGFVVETLIDGSPSTEVLQSGDIIKKVDGKEFQKLSQAVATACCREISVERGGGDEPVKLSPRINLENGTALIGIVMGRFPEIASVKAGTIAAKYLQPGYIVSDMVISSNEAKTTTLTWLSPEGKSGQASFDTPDNIRQQILTNKSKYITGGLYAAVFYNSIGERKAGSLASAASMAFDTSIEMSLTVYKMLHRLVTRQIDSSGMSGPLGIIRIMKQTAEREDAYIQLIRLMALISINLAIFNLLPFPVLDGGHLAFIAAEKIKGSPPGDWFKEISQYFGVVILLSLMLYVTYNDIGRWWRDYNYSTKIEKLSGNDE